MADPVTISLISMAVGAASSIGGTVYSAQQGQKASEASMQAEAARKKQAKLEELQKRRQIIRQSQLARATSLANLSSQGVSQGSSAYTGVTSASLQGAVQLNDLTQASGIGEEIFNANATMSEAQGGMALGQGMSSFGKDIYGSSEAIGRIGSTLFNSSSKTY